MSVKWGRLVLAAAVMAAGRPHTVTGDELTVVTINVWSGLDYKGYLKMGVYEEKKTREARTQVLVRQLQALAPDIVALNEANHLPRYTRRIARELGFDHVDHLGVGGLRAGPIGLPVNLREGDVILARPQLDLRAAGRRQLSGGPVGRFFTAHTADATQVLAGSLCVGERTVYVFCTHWHASPFPTETYFAELERRRSSGRLEEKALQRLKAQAIEGQAWRLGETRKMLEFVRQVAGDEPAILMGDFNALPDSEEISLLLQAGFVDAFAAAGTGEGITWHETGNPNIRLQRETYPDEVPQDPPDKRIDFIFVRGAGLEVTEARVVLDEPLEGRYASDHYGVLARVRVR